VSAACSVLPEITKINVNDKQKKATLLLKKNMNPTMASMAMLYFAKGLLLVMTMYTLNSKTVQSVA
jgi:hypothetical protein